MTCTRCGEEILDAGRPHGSPEECLNALRFAVAGLSRYVARVELDALAARREAQALKALLLKIADIARPEAAPMVLPSLLRRIRKLATGQPCSKGRSSAA